MLKKFDKILCCFEDGLLVFLFLSSAIVLFINVVLRYVWNSGLIGAEEYAQYAILCMTFAGCGAAARKGAHMRITALFDLSKTGKLKFCLDVFADVAAIAFSVFLLITGTRMALASFGYHQTTSTLGIPMWIIELSVPIGGLSMGLRYLQQLLLLIQNHRDGRASA